VGNQTEEDEKWLPEKQVERVKETIELTIEGRHVRVGAWRYFVRRSIEISRSSAMDCAYAAKASGAMITLSK
jgi:hypothetical protein